MGIEYTPADNVEQFAKVHSDLGKGLEVALEQK
jgi:hypothetical protein